MNQPVLRRCIHDDARLGQSDLDRGGPTAVPYTTRKPPLPRHPERLEHAMLPDALGEAVQVVRSVTRTLSGSG